MDDAVGAANTARSGLSASSARGGCFQVKSIITPRKLVTVTPFSRSWSTHRLALNFEPHHEPGAGDQRRVGRHELGVAVEQRRVTVR